MTVKILIAVGLGVLLFELTEHLIFPLIWLVKDRKKRRRRALDRLVGQEAEVTRWRGQEGQVFIKGELWRAVSGDPLAPGARVVVERAEGLTLTVAPAKARKRPRGEGE